MTTKTERKSNIEINVLDLNGLKNDAEEEIIKILSKEGKKLIKITSQNIGYIKTKKGTFVLDSEGTGNINSISKENKAEIFFYAEYEKDNKKSLNVCPIIKCVCDLEDIEKIPILKKENLVTFIRSFGSRLESNFRQWNDFLSPIV